MKLTTIITSVALASTLVVAGLDMQSANAMTAPEGGSGISCVVKPVGAPGAGDASHRYTINKDGTVTARFEVKGENCKETMTLVSWTAPNGTDGMPYSAQKVFSHTTGTYKTGKHTLTTKLPNCYFQVDLITGSNWSSFPATTFSSQGVLRSSLHGGAQSCDTTVVTPPTPTPTVTVPTELAKTGASANVVIPTVIATIVAATVGFRSYLVRKNA